MKKLKLKRIKILQQDKFPSAAISQEEGVWFQLKDIAPKIGAPIFYVSLDSEYSLIRLLLKIEKNKGNYFWTTIENGKVSFGVDWTNMLFIRKW
jgi:hypothetical protein